MSSRSFIYVALLYRDRHAEIRRVPSPRFLLLLRLYATFEGVAQQPRIRFFISAAVIILFTFALCEMCLNIRVVNYWAAGGFAGPGIFGPKTLFFTKSPNKS
jgi:hypothetical protein